MVVMKELDIAKFNLMYNTFMAGLQKDSITSPYHKYLKANYDNCKKQWAYCHRRGLRITTNMALESMHHIVKHNFFKGHVVKRLDGAIHHLLQFLEDKRQDWILCQNKGKIKKDSKTFKFHKTAVQNQNDFMIQPLSSNSFKVSNLIKGTTYKVNFKDKCEDEELCQLACRDCNMCLDRLTCECIMNQIYFEFCKHCHLALLYKAGKLDQNKTFHEFDTQETFSEQLKMNWKWLSF